MTPEDAVFAAAARAGVTLRELTEMEEIHAVVRLLGSLRQPAGHG